MTKESFFHPARQKGSIPINGDARLYTMLYVWPHLILTMQPGYFIINRIKHLLEELLHPLHDELLLPMSRHHLLASAAGAGTSRSAKFAGKRGWEQENVRLISAAGRLVSEDDRLVSGGELPGSDNGSLKSANELPVSDEGGLVSANELLVSANGLLTSDHGFRGSKDCAFSAYNDRLVSADGLLASAGELPVSGDWKRVSAKDLSNGIQY
jgi:hypothetical protein